MLITLRHFTIYLRPFETLVPCFTALFIEYLVIFAPHIQSLQRPFQKLLKKIFLL